MVETAATPTAPGPLFIPKETVSVVIGRQSVHLYPDIHPSMSIAEKAHGFHITTTNLRSARLTPDVYVDHLGMHLDSTTIVAGLKYDFNNHLMKNWLNNDHLRLLSFHNTAGTDITVPATTADDRQVLKPVQNGVIADCRPGDVRYVRYELDLDFADLCTGSKPGENTRLRSTYYLELPQTTVEVQDGNDNPRQLTTFHGTSDLRTLTVQQMDDDILRLVPQDCPITLQQHDAFVTNARVDDSSAMEEINRAVLKLAIPTIEKAIFKSLCPNFTAKPHAAVEGLSQTTTDAEGNIQILPVAHFHSILQRAMQPFAHMETFPVNVCDIFQRGLHEDVRAVYNELYPQHTDPVAYDGRTQRQKLPEMLEFAIRAEERVLAQQRMWSRSMGQTFVAGTYAHATAYASQAERTISQYQRPGTSLAPTTASNYAKRPAKTLSPGQRCFGCGSTSHPFSLCPNRKDPAVRAAAHKKFDELRAGYKSGKKRRMEKGKPNLDDFDQEHRNALIAQALAAKEGTTEVTTDTNSSVNSSVTDSHYSPTVGRGRGRPSYRPSGNNGNGNPAVFLSEAVALATGGKPVLPVSIESNLAHIGLRLSGTGSSDSPVLMACVDTAASMVIGNSSFLFKVAQSYPSCVSQVFSPNDYSPITLSGVVRRGGDAVTTTLPVAFCFNMDYQTVDGQPAQLMIAAGPDVNVNLILGNPFIRASSMIIDYGDNVAELTALDCPPFPLEFRQARLTVPTPPDAKATGHSLDTYGALISDLQRLEAFVSSAYEPPRQRKRGADKQVNFSEDTTIPPDMQKYFGDFDTAGPLPREVLTDTTDEARGSQVTETESESE